MSQRNRVYQWTKQDRTLHLIPAIPLILFYAGTTFLLAKESLGLMGIFLLLWVGVNFAITGICAGCPYRGGYCPGISQLYFAPYLSLVLYRNPDRISTPRSFKKELLLLGIIGIGSYAFAIYWLFRIYWESFPLVVLALIALLLMHMPLSFFILCPKCGYNDTCPMSKVHKSIE
jgi:hypothetical protein